MDEKINLLDNETKFKIFCETLKKRSKEKRGENIYLYPYLYLVYQLLKYVKLHIEDFDYWTIFKTYFEMIIPSFILNYTHNKENAIDCLLELDYIHSSLNVFSSFYENNPHKNSLKLRDLEEMVNRINLFKKDIVSSFPVF